MNIALILFVIGIVFIVHGYTLQVTPQCNKDLKVKVVPRDVFDEIMMNQELSDTIYNDM